MNKNCREVLALGAVGEENEAVEPLIWAYLGHAPSICMHLLVSTAHLTSCLVVWQLEINFHCLYLDVCKCCLLSRLEELKQLV